MSDNLRNFDLTVEEIKIVKMMEALIDGLERLQFNDPLSPRAEFFRCMLSDSRESLDLVPKLKSSNLI